MKLGFYYKLYRRFRTGKVLSWSLAVARKLGIRYLLVRMDTNFLCNIRCQTCYFSDPEFKQNFVRPMDLALFKAIAQSVFPKTRILYLSCGAEPLMTKGFENFLEVTGRYSVPYAGYVTNALLFTESIIQSSIDNKITEITISIDGATRDTFEYIRKGGKFDVLLSKLGLLKDMFSRSKKQVPLLRFNYTVTRSNHLEMPLLVELGKRFGVSVIKFRIFEDWGGTLPFDKESLIGCEESFNRSLADAKHRAEAAKIEIIAPKEFSSDGENVSENVLDLLEKVSSPPCVYPWFFRYIDPKGRVRVCTHLSLSNVCLDEKYSLNDFEESEEETRRKYLLTNQPSESCFVNVCKGAYLRRANDDVNFLKRE